MSIDTTEKSKIESIETSKKIASYIISVLGALGTALQNYMAVELFIKGLLNGVIPMSRLVSAFVKAVAVSAGGMCSGMVNFFINVQLLEAFFKRMGKKNDVKLEGWRKFRYYAGTFVFVLTGVLFGMTAFTFGAASPLAVLALASGIFVAVIMTIQEVETWLQSFDSKAETHLGLKAMFKKWKSELTLGKAFGHIIAAGNVLALSLLFTLGFAEVLISLHFAAFTALIVSAIVSFTVGAFTEFYFYNFFLAAFCEKIKGKWNEMKNTNHSALGCLCIGTNAFVNGALTFSGVGLLTGLLVAAGVALPPVGIIIGLSAISGFFSGAASLVLGMDFWIGKMSKKPRTIDVIPAKSSEIEPSSSTAANDSIISSAMGNVFSPVISSESTVSKEVAKNDESIYAVPNMTLFSSTSDAPMVVGVSCHL